jgi:predicted Zn finger-like uncharacterized protein
MAIEITCPSCQRRLRVPDDLLGKLVKCPSCADTFRAAASEPAPAAPPAHEEEPAPPINAQGEIIRGDVPPRSARPDRDREDDEYADRGPRRRGRDREDREEHEDRGSRRSRRRRDDDDEDYPRWDGREAARNQVAGPAIGLMANGIISILLGLFYIGMGVFMAVVASSAAASAPPPPGGGPSTAEPIMVGVMYGGMGLFIIAYACVILYGAIKLKRLESFGLAMTASIMSIVPCGQCWLLGIPFGIWALVVINRPEVKEAFR